MRPPRRTRSRLRADLLRGDAGALFDSGLARRAAALRRIARLHRAGIIDGHLDEHLDGIAPPGYYRMTFQTRQYTRQKRTRQFDVLDHVARGLNGHQDLVVLRRT